MGLTEDIADKLAQDVLAAEEEYGDETLVKKVSDLVGTSSTTMQDAFLTAVRVRRAETRGRQALDRAIAELRAKKDS